MLSVALGFVAGLVAWTLLEYIIHYPLGHLPKGKILISSEHLKHHANILYFTPVRLKIVGALPVLGLLLLISAALFGIAVAAGFVAAVAVGWTIYEWLHQSIHVNGPTNRYSRWAARHHLSHHFTRPNCNHGVTTPIWDMILGTYEPAARVRVGRKHLAGIPWMKSAASDTAVQPAFMADYELV